MDHMAADGGETVGRLPDLHSLLGRFADAFGLHVFAGEVIDGEFFETFAGPGMETLLGGRPPGGPDTGEFWSDRVHPDDRTSYRDAMNSIHAGGSAQVDYRLLGVDGVTRWVRECGHAWSADGRVFVDGLALDVSESMKLRMSLRTAA